MRLRIQDQREVFLYPMTSNADGEGNFDEAWGTAVGFKATVQPAGGRLLTQMYGERLAYMQTLITQSMSICTGISEKAGIGLYVGSGDEPDYLVVSVQTFATHKVVLIEQRGDVSGHRV